MTRLGTLRSQLAALRRARAGVRAATAWSSLATAILWALAGVLAVDLLFELAVFPRLVLILLAAGGVLWAYSRFTRPLLGHAETEVDMALLVERQERIDSDLVAALQFESTEAARWGSPRLAGAVIDYVAAVGPGINVFAGFSREQMTRRGVLLGVTALLLLVGAALFPGHVAVFFNRLLLGSQHYPTRTRIEQIFVGEQRVLLSADHGTRPQPLKAAQGRPVRFLVIAAGQVPPTGTIAARARDGGTVRTTIDLAPLSDDQRASLSPTQLDLLAESPYSTVFAGTLLQLLEDTTYQVFLGDAWTDPATIAMVHLPTIETELSLVPPRYAVRGSDKIDPASRQVSVLEGTSAGLVVRSTNRKPLAEVTLKIGSGESQTSHALAVVDDAATDGAATEWSLPRENSPLANIREEIRYELVVVDTDGLGPDAPIRGTIRIRPDRLPTASADVVHKVVLPTAEPVIEFRAADDYGLARLVLVAEIERFDPARAAGITGDLGTGIAPAAEEVPAETRRFELLAGPPVAADRLPLVGRYPLALSRLALAKGDRVKLTLEATDYRGEDDAGRVLGESQASESLILEISDESGVLAAISEADQRSEERLTDLIKRQLGIGESP
jgi:hypothetical protein